MIFKDLKETVLKIIYLYLGDLGRMMADPLLTERPVIKFKVLPSNELPDYINLTNFNRDQHLFFLLLK